MQDQFYREPQRPILDNTHVGTRLEHYTQLLDLWSGGLAILLSKSEASRSPREINMLEQLTHAIELLEKNMTGINSGYDDSSVRRLIDGLPRNAEEIRD